MLKYVAVFTAFIANGPPVDVVDVDGPHRFATVEECTAHLNKSVEPLKRILGSYTGNLDVMLLGECIEEDVAPDTAEPVK